MRSSVAGTFNHDDNAVELHTIPLFHANGWGRPQASTMMGIKQVMVRRFEPARCLPPDPGGEGHRHVAGADDGERAAELRRTWASSTCRSLQGDPRGRRGGFAGTDRAHGAGISLQRGGRLRADRDLPRCSPRPAPRAPSSMPTRPTGCGSRRWRAGRYRACEVRVVDLHMHDVPRDMQIDRRSGDPRRSRDGRLFPRAAGAQRR